MFRDNPAPAAPTALIVLKQSTLDDKGNC